MTNYLLAVKAPFKGVFLCLSDSRLRKLSSKPLLAGLLSWPLSVAFAVFSHPYASELIDSTATSWWAPIWNWTGSIITAGLLFGFSLLLSMSLVLILSGVFQASITRKVFEMKNVALPKKEAGIAGEAGRTIWVETAKLFWILPLTILAFICGLLPFLTPFALLVTSWLLGFQFLDIALDNLKLGAFARIKLCLKHFLKTSIFGGILVICWAVPFLGILVAPGAAAGAAWFLAESGLVPKAKERE